MKTQPSTNDKQVQASSTRSRSRMVERRSFSFATTSDDEFDEILLPPPPSQPFRKVGSVPFASDRTPLVAPKIRKQKLSSASCTVLFGRNNLDRSVSRASTSTSSATPAAEVSYPTRLLRVSRFFLGFMYEETDPDCEESESSTTTELFRPLKLALCFSFMLTSAASTVPVILVPVIGQNLSQSNLASLDVTSFTSRAASSAVLGLAIGKFVNGPLGDIFGARRISMLFATLLSLSLLFLSICWNESSTLWACFLVEFFQSVQWPGIIVILATHARGHLLDSGIYSTLLSSRFGSLLAIPLTTLLLRYFNWRLVCALASLSSLFGAGIVLLCVADSPSKSDDPQNPISSSTLNHFFSKMEEKPPISLYILTIATTFRNIFVKDIVPSLLAVISRSTFWVVAIAHAGDAMVGSSQRVLGTYYYDTYSGSLPEYKASGLAVVLSFGTILGLAIAGNVFTKSNNPRNRKQLIAKLYMLSIASCYLLALLAIPKVQQVIGEADLTLAFQLIGSFFMGFGGAVQSYIPGIVGATFGRNKGLFSAYADGVAYGLSSIVWRVVGGAVFGGGSAGWAYGWAAVALLIVICAFLMVEFFENYFVRRERHSSQDQGGSLGYETIIFV